MKKSVVVLFAAIMIGSLVPTAFLSMNYESSQNAAMNAQLVQLQKDYDSLRLQYYELAGNFSSLQYNYSSILLQDPLSFPNPGGSGALDTQQMLTRYQALQEMYFELQSEYSQYITNYQTLKSLTDLRVMQGDLSYLITPANPAVVSIVHNITGKTGNKTDPNSYWKDIKAMYDWVATNIKYRVDSLYPVLPDNPADAVNGLTQTDSATQYPNETLAFRAGDCDDIASLLTSMIRCYFSNQFLVECIWITGANAGHVAVVIPFSGDQIVILDPIRGYYSHDTLGNIALNMISSEIYNWLNLWRSSLGNDVHVYRVYSDYMDKTFNGTEEYVNWSYNR